MLSFRQFLDEATFAKVDRVRGGKIQKQKKVSQRPSYRMQDKKLVRKKVKSARSSIPFEEPRDYQTTAISDFFFS